MDAESARNTDYGRIGELFNFLSEPIRINEELSFTVLSIIIGLLLLIILFMAVGILRRFLANHFFPRFGLVPGVASAVATLAYYFIIVVGLLVILPIIFPGFNLGTLTVVLGALSFGIGFGLRNVADNFFSGLIILMERPIKVGDRIEVAGVHGSVVEIRARSTTVRTNDNIDIIIPNSQFISYQVTNLSHNDEVVRFKVPVGVHYSSNVHLVEKALLEAADEAPHVLKDPAPAVRFLEFGDSSLNFELRVWSDSLYQKPNALISEVNFLVWDKLKKHGIEIPYPQRDLYIKEMPQTT